MQIIFHDRYCLAPSMRRSPDLFMIYIISEISTSKKTEGNGRGGGEKGKWRELIGGDGKKGREERSREKCEA